MFYGKSSVLQTGPQSDRVVLQLHPKLDLIHHKHVLQGVQVPKIRPTVHWVLLLGPV